MCNRRWILLFLTGCFAFSEGYHLHEHFTLSRFKRQNSNCSLSEYNCVSGECITEDAICDGFEDCVDGSDESNCATFPCPKFLFKCEYGACINAGYVCDGKKHCKDNSDESDALCAGKKPLSKCSRYQFQCDNSECISDTDICDGKADCADGSDETEKICADFNCPNFAFRCDYGGCISSALKCNGINNCNDGSDERNCSGRPSPVPPKRNGCTLPPHPANGKWSFIQEGLAKTTGDWVESGTVVLYKCNTGFGLSPDTSYLFCNIDGWPAIPTCLPISTTTAKGPGSCVIPNHPQHGQLIDRHGDLFKPGSTVEKGTNLQVKCNKGYALNPHETREATCDGSWSKIPTCLQTCVSAEPKPGSNMNVRCTLNDYKVNCDTPVDGTWAIHKCSPLYEVRSVDASPSRFCKEGTWDFGEPRCEPKCGYKSNQARPLVIGGNPSKKGEYPWMVGLYRTNDTKHFCGGTMITPKITLSAAHCFVTQGSLDPARYSVAAGKFFREYRDANDMDAQYSDLANIKIPPEYNSDQSYYAFDIAILVLKTPFKISASILPICIEYNTNYDEKNLIGESGIVTGWGYTTKLDAPSSVLKELSLDYKTSTQCKLLPDFRQFYQYAKDKMCAKSAQPGQSLCEGDSGGGLIFREYRARFYIRGIVSVGAQDKRDFGCDLTEPVLFTAVAHHSDFIQQNL